VDAGKMSHHSFVRKFKKIYDMTAKEYIRHLRVQEAWHKLAQSMMSFTAMKETLEQHRGWSILIGAVFIQK